MFDECEVTKEEKTTIAKRLLKQINVGIAELELQHALAQRLKDEQKKEQLFKAIEEQEKYKAELLKEMGSYTQQEKKSDEQ